ncbi:MAG: thioesterase family protein [Kofleriaceae bacterium]|nr:thioesterase family protein [Kofleriaceae bacterium]
MTLAEVTTPSGDTLVVHEGWRQGRGAFGGLTIAAAIRAIEQRVADPRRVVRSVTAELPAPTLPGEAAVEVDILRSGSSLTVARAALRQRDEVTTHVVAVLAASRPVDEAGWQELSPPSAPAWESLAPIEMQSGAFPEFALNFEYRLVSGIPFGGRGEPVTVGYIRAREPGEPRDAAFIAAMMDAWWPATLVRQKGPRPLATIAYTLEIVDGVAGLDRDAPLLYRGTVPVNRDGYFLETRELWGGDGRLVARNHQTFAIIR